MARIAQETKCYPSDLTDEEWERIAPPMPNPGRKRHIAVDPDRRLLMVNLTTADTSDSVGAQAILDAIHKRWP